MGIEESRRRNEANMKRKLANSAPSLTTSVSGTDTPPSPGAGTGAIDDLLAKLRAAKPEARDQRDRRRRARLKDRHADRVASGQKMPDLQELVKSPSSAEGDMLSPVRSEISSSQGGSEEGGPLSAGLSVNDDEDVADQAERLLLGLKGEGSADGDEVELGDGVSPVPRESIRMSRRRKEGAEDERAKRRRRRQLALSASEASLENHTRNSGASYRDSTSGQAEGPGEDDDGGETPKQPQAHGDVGDDMSRHVIVHPPSPDSTPTKMGDRGLPTPPGD